MGKGEYTTIGNDNPFPIVRNKSGDPSEPAYEELVFSAFDEDNTAFHVSRLCRINIVYRPRDEQLGIWNPFHQALPFFSDRTKDGLVRKNVRAILYDFSNAAKRFDVEYFASGKIIDEMGGMGGKHELDIFGYASQ